ncbi:MAG TPA: cytochrome c [Aggregatilineales bacterium]|nr:cytochrome c [Aggregatilineales bacterium]
MDDRWRISCCGLPLIFTMCICFTLILIVAGRSTSDSQQTQGLDGESHQAQSVQEQHSSGDTQIQILGKRFDATELTQGQTIYTQYCAACHGIEGQGQFPAAPLEPDATGRIGAPPHNEIGHSWHHSDVLLIRYVTEGGFSDPTRFYPMPPFGGILTDEQILFVIAYIKTMWTDEQRASQRQLTEEEQRMFSD